MSLCSSSALVVVSGSAFIRSARATELSEGVRRGRRGELRDGGGGGGIAEVWGVRVRTALALQWGVPLRPFGFGSLCTTNIAAPRGGIVIRQLRRATAGRAKTIERAGATDTCAPHRRPQRARWHRAGVNGREKVWVQQTAGIMCRVNGREKVWVQPTAGIICGVNGREKVWVQQTAGIICRAPRGPHTGEALDVGHDDCRGVARPGRLAPPLAPVDKVLHARRSPAVPHQQHAHQQHDSHEASKRSHHPLPVVRLRRRRRRLALEEDLRWPDGWTSARVWAGRRRGELAHGWAGRQLGARARVRAVTSVGDAACGHTGRISSASGKGRRIGARLSNSPRRAATLSTVSTGGQTVRAPIREMPPSAGV
eukprot:361300-Chlamydomonas_euryale.AAC.3